MNSRFSMSVRRRVAAFFVIGLVPVLMGGPPAVPAAGRARPDACPPWSLRAADLPGRFDWACNETGLLVIGGGVGVHVPPPGLGVSVAADTRNGPSALTVTTLPDGGVVVAEDGGAEPAPGSKDVEDATALAGSRSKNPCKHCKPACDDRAATIYDYHVAPGDTFEWWFNRNSTPAPLTPDQVQDALVNGMNKVMISRNQCRMPDRISLQTEFMGDSSATAQISPSIVCDQVPDGSSVVDFGALQAPAATCTWFVFASGRDHVVESDVRIDAGRPWTTVLGPSCNNAFDVEGMSIHERGHTFGLGHVGPRHGNLTMSTYGLPECSRAYRTFGRGDVRGLRTLY